MALLRMMVLGSWYEASCSSSDMCAAQRLDISVLEQGMLTCSIGAQQRKDPRQNANKGGESRTAPPRIEKARPHLP